MMKHYLDLAALSDRAHRRQSRMTRLCIVLAVFLVAVMFGLADMYLQGMVIETRQQTGDWHCRFTAIDRETAAFVASRPEVDFSGWQGAVIAETGCTLAGQPAALAGMDEALFTRVYSGTFPQGRAPAAQEEIAVSDTLARAAGLTVGDRAALQGPGGTVYRTVSGIFPAQAGQLAAGSASAVLMTPQALADLAPVCTTPAWQYMVQFSPLCRMADVIDDITRTNGLDAGQVVVNEELLSMLGQLPGSNVNQIYGMAVLLSLVVMATCVLMISSSLNSNVSQRTEFFGLMRCLGATRRQTARFVRREALQWCVTAIPVGLGLSVLVVWALCAVMRHFSSVWFGSIPLFGISWLSLCAATVLGLLTVLLAARTPARQAARVSPLEAVAGNPGQARPFRHAANTRRWPVEIALGVHHARSRRRSYLLMTSAFALCLTLFLGFCTLVPFMKNAFAPKAWTPDLSIVSETNTCSIAPALLDAVAAEPSVQRVYGRMFAYDVPVQIGGQEHRCTLVSLDAQQLEWAAPQLAAGSMDSVSAVPGQVLFVANTGTQAAVADSLTLTLDGRPQTVTVGGLLTDHPLARTEGAETLLCSEQTFTRLTGADGYTILDVQFRFGADESDVAAVEALFTGGVTFTDDLPHTQQQWGLYYAFSVLVYGFLSIIVAITMFHIMNTVRMGVAARSRQYGVLRAIGMSGRQLTRMVAAEAAAYAAGGVVLGFVLGLWLHWFLYSSLVTRTFGTPWTVPWPELGLIAAVILLTTALSVHGPVKRLRALSITDTLTAQ